MAVAEILEEPQIELVDEPAPRACVNHQWSPDEEDILRAAIASGRALRLVALKLGRSLIAVRSKAKRMARPRRHHPWTQERTNELAELVERHAPWPRIARIMGNSESYLKTRASSLGISRRTANGYTQAAVSRIMGVDSHGVDIWARKGWIRATRTRVKLGHGVMVVIRHEDLIAFLGNEHYWPAWNPERITDSGIREWAMEMRAGVEYLTTTQAAPLLFITPLGLQKAIREGRVKARKIHTKWFIRRDELVPMPGNMGPRGPYARPFTEAETETIRGLWGVVPATEIARRLGRKRSSVVHSAARRMGLPRIGRGYWKAKQAREGGTSDGNSSPL